MNRAPSLLLASLLTGALVAGPVAQTQAASPDRLPTAVAKAKVKTPFAFTTSGFGSRVSGGDLPVASDATALQVISCTRLAGTDKTTTQASQVLPGIGTLSGAQTRSSTTKSGRTVTARTVHTIAKVTLVDSPLGSLEIQGLRSESKAQNVAGKYRASTDTDIGRIVFTAPGGVAQTLPLPAPNRPVEVPGLARIAVGTTSTSTSKAAASANANVLDVQVIPTGSRAILAQSRARLDTAPKTGLFLGRASGLTASGLADNLNVGRTPNNPMPCVGTGGKTKRADLARLDLGDAATAQGLTTSHRTTRSGQKVTGVSRGGVADIVLADGRVEIKGIVGQVTVSRGAKGITRSTKGSTIGTITVDGRPVSLDRLGDLTIPGLIDLERNVTTKLSSGLQVVGLRATLLDGSAAKFDLGVARLQVQGVR